MSSNRTSVASGSSMNKQRNSAAGFNKTTTFFDHPTEKPKPAAATGQSSYTEPTNYRIAKDGWGSRSNFQCSYGLDFSLEGIEEGK